MAKTIGNKFHAKKAELSGDKFDSIKEMRYFAKCQIFMKVGIPDKDRIEKIERQVRYDAIINGKLCFFYKLDFKVTYGDGRIEHIDVKGSKVGASYAYFRLKKKVIEAIHGIEIIEK